MNSRERRNAEAPAGPAPGGASYTAVDTETSTAIAIATQEIRPNPLGTSATGDSCPAIAARRTVKVQLSAPLGNRVLINPDGTPIAVTTQ